MKNQARSLLVLTLGACAPWFGSGCVHLERPVEEPGARVPWTRYEAERARSNVTPVPPDRSYLTPASEASGRSYVRLGQTGDYVDFTAARPANGLVLRFSLPDGEQGQGVDATLSLLINGQPVRKLDLTSRYAWSYGDFPWSNDPAAGRGHHFFDEVQALIPNVQAGDVIRLQRDDTDNAPYYLVDFIELEAVPPPLPPPTNSLSIAEFGGVPDDGADDTSAFLTLLEAARQQQKIAWLPPGTFRLEGSFKGLGNVDLRGAGMWHSRLAGPGAMFYGFGARFAVSDLAIFGEISHRNDMSPDNAFNGNFGDGTTLTRVWMEHVKCGLWSTHGTRNLRLTGCRIRNTMADGLNLCDGTTDSTVEQCHVRNTGDDGLATWSPTGDWSSKQICQRNRFLHNTVENPWHANGLGIYGGRDHEVRGNLVVDTVQSGGGLLISSGHGACPFEGTLVVEDNRFIRTGGECYVDGHCGSLWIHAKDSDMDTPVLVRNLVIEQPGYAGITLHGPRPIRNLTLDNVAIRGQGEPGLVRMPSAGETSLVTNNVRVLYAADSSTP